jgi:predicted transcriptional regulator
LKKKNFSRKKKLVGNKVEVWLAVGSPFRKYILLFVCVGVVYSGEYDVCGVTLSVHHIHIGQTE